MHMSHALHLAEAGWGRVHPNPMVGAVLVRDGIVVGEGWHEEFGGPHAEIVAIRQAGESARGATLYVTLEPCAHHGKTPPCTQAILEAGIARVVFGAADTSPTARGGGSVLATAGLEVRGGVLADQARRLNAAFHHVSEQATPFVALKLAMTLDGRISRERGRPTVVTGEAARAEVHRLRAGFDAILIGAGTLRADNPALNVRGALVPRVPPVRIVLAGREELPASGRVFTEPGGPVWIVTTPEAAGRHAAAAQKGARVLEARASDHGVDPVDALAVLRAEGIRSIFCEGGSALAASLLARGAVQRIYLFVAPRFFGTAGPPAFAADRVDGRWAVVDNTRLGDDVLLVIDREPSES